MERTTSATRLELRNTDKTILAATDLARREKACGVFLEFRLVILADALCREISTSDESQISLADLSFLSDLPDDVGA